MGTDASIQGKYDTLPLGGHTPILSVNVLPVVWFGFHLVFARAKGLLFSLAFVRC